MTEQAIGASGTTVQPTYLNSRKARTVQLQAPHDKSVQILFCVLLFLVTTLATMQAYGNRAHIFQLDAICYLDLSDSVMRGDWKEVVNAHWGPLYPVQLAITRAIFGTDPHFETAILKIVNVFNFLLALTAFYWFLQAFLDLLKKTADKNYIVITPVVSVLTLFSGFTWCTLVLGGIYVDTPDQFAFASVIAATAIVLRTKTIKRLEINGIFLGLILALGYLSKAVVLPVALVYFGIIILSTDVPLTRRLRLVSFAITSFFILAAPWIYFLSNKVGHFTFSDSSWFAYITFVQNTSHFIRVGLPDSVFTHPARMLTLSPPTLEFATPVAGTYPLWYDGIYWNQGVHAKLSLRIFSILSINLLYYTVLLLPIVGAYLLQFAVSFPRMYPLRGIGAAWKLWVPALIGIAMYSVAIPMILIGHSRYVASSVFLLMAAILASLRIKNNARGIITMFLTLSILILYPLFDTINEALTDFKLVLNTPSYRHWHIAEALKGLGVKPGDRVAIMGGEENQAWYRCAPLSPRLTRVQQAWYLWARLARVKVVAQVSPIITTDAVQAFLNCSDEDKKQLYQKLSDLGVTAIVYNPSNDFDTLESGARSQSSDFQPGFAKTVTMPTGWQELNKMHAYAYILPHPKKIVIPTEKPKLVY